MALGWIHSICEAQSLRDGPASTGANVFGSALCLLFVFLLTIALPRPVSAGYMSGKVERTYSQVDGNGNSFFFVKLSGPTGTLASCAKDSAVGEPTRPFEFAIRITQTVGSAPAAIPGRNALVSQVLMAAVMKVDIVIQGKGTCVDWADREDILYVTVFFD